MHPFSDYVLDSGSNLGTTAGIAVSGGLIFNALDGNNLDAVENEGDTLDVCSMHPSPSGGLHYHFWGACLNKNYGFWSDTEAPALCKDTDNCVTKQGPFNKDASNSFYTARNWDKPIGLARDGHIILGPYKSDGEIYGCDDHDICNGAFVGDDKDVYAYVGTDTFPYVVGCWGPGPQQNYTASCSSSSCGSTG